VTQPKQTDILVTGSSSEWRPKHLDIVAVVFVTALLVSNLAAVKLFQLGPATFTGGILVFPISYIFGDVLTEVYGYARTRRVIYAGLFANVFMVAVLSMTIMLPPAPGWPLQESFAAIYEMTPRIVAASVVGYWAGEFVNSFILSRIKVWMGGSKLWVRTISSTVVGQFVDTCLFAFIAFGGVIPGSLLVTAVLSGWLFKVVYEALATPLTYLVVGKLKRAEGVDHFDRIENYNPFRL
jgi:uncharacterized integral membrane protein (TIGR00697 family)